MVAEGDIDLIVQNEFFSGRKRFFSMRKKNVLVEVGAARPDYLSISASFRDLGWEIVSIEPNPVFCEAHRAKGYDVLQYACSDVDADDVDFFVVSPKEPGAFKYMDGQVSYESFSSLGINGKFADLHETVETDVRPIKVKVRKLDTVLASHKPDIRRIDVLAVDVEGWELNVMRGFSLGKFKPKVVILENLFQDSSIPDYMKEHGYVLWPKSAVPNEVYMRRSWFSSAPA